MGNYSPIKIKQATGFRDTSDLDGEMARTSKEYLLLIGCEKKDGA
jgi:hypothetical protein